MPEVSNIQDIVCKFLSLTAKSANDHAKKQVAYARIVNDNRQLRASPYVGQMNHTHVVKRLWSVLYCLLFRFSVTNRSIVFTCARELVAKPTRN